MLNFGEENVTFQLRELAGVGNVGGLYKMSLSVMSRMIDMDKKKEGNHESYDR